MCYLVWAYQRGGGLLKEFMQIQELRAISLFCTSTRFNFSKKHLQEFGYKTRENKRTLHFDTNDSDKDIFEARCSK